MKKILASALVLSSMVTCTPLAAQDVCLPRQEAVENVQKYQNRSRIVASINSDGRLMEVWVDPEGSWLLLLTHPQTNLTCAAMSGTDYLQYDFVTGELL